MRTCYHRQLRKKKTTHLGILLCARLCDVTLDALETSTFRCDALTRCPLQVALPSVPHFGGVGERWSIGESGSIEELGRSSLHFRYAVDERVEGV